jgi:hypothetical protein
MRSCRVQFGLSLLAIVIGCLLWSSITLAETAPNPHWNKDGCGTCHQGKPGPVTTGTITASCLKCHDGQHASDEAHPVGRTMKATMVDPGWPTLNGSVQCLTCHNIKMQCDTNALRTEDNSSFLRSGTNPQTPFCDNCHRDLKVTRLNPHLMIDADTHKPITKSCDLCHEKPMDPTITMRTGNSLLRADQAVLCKSCHPHHKDISPTGHVGTAIPESMLVYMRARELTGLLDSPSPDLIDELTAKHARPQKMVGDANDRIVCTTCHNPHQQGVFASDCDLADRSLRLVKGHLITSTRSELFCRKCHKV